MKKIAERSVLPFNKKTGIFLMSAFVLTMAATSMDVKRACAEGMEIVKARVVHKAVSGQALPTPGEKGHVVAMGQRVGQVDFNGKESAKYESTAMVDAWVGQKGNYKGYSRYTFKDGSEIYFSWTAEGSRNKKGLPMQQGRGVIKKGTGRFKGIQGQALFTTTQQKPTSEDPSRTSVAETILFYELP